MSKSFISFFLSLCSLCFSIGAQATGSITAGRQKASMCEACHGLDGRSRMPEVPNLWGQVEGYLLAQLRAFKTGERRNEQMAIIVQSLASQDMEDLASYFSAIQVKLEKVPGQ